jgi:hypothetical protein
MSFFEQGVPVPPVPDNRIERLYRVYQNKLILKIGIVLITIVLAFIVTVLMIYLFAIKKQYIYIPLVPPDALTSSIIATSQTIGTDNGKQSVIYSRI